MNAHLDLLLSPIYDSMTLHPEHRADLQKSGITDDTIQIQKIRTVPPAVIDRLLGFGAPSVEHAYVIPYPDPRGGWMDHVRLRTFPEGDELRGDHVEEHRERYSYNGGRRKYLTRRAAPARLFYPLATMAATIHGPEDLWIVEGPKKGLSIAQLGLPAVAIESAWSWCVKGSRGELIPDFADITLSGRRTVKVVPDPDAMTTPQIGHAMHRLAEALERRGARVQIVVLPAEVVLT